MADCLPSLFIEIGKCIWDSFLKPHVDYWWCFDDNIQQLRDGIQDLERLTHDIQQKIEGARRNAEILRPGVQEWFNSSIHKLEEARTTLPNDNTPDAWKLISRYSLGKTAKETAKEIAKHLNNGKFELIADPSPSVAMGFTSHKSTMDFKSREHIEEEIIDSLKQSSVGMIGICGMGGIGKTTMAKRIGVRVKEGKQFEEVVMVTVSQKIDMPKIQSEIADLLKLKYDESSMPARAHQLRTRLMDTKKKLVILDDVWESLKFEELGIPIEWDPERCKVLLTSRSRDTCKTIKNKRVFELKILEKNEAWILFKEKAGECIEHPALRSVATDVAAECKGLPIALVTVGLSLQDEMDIRAWKNSRLQLRQSNPTDLPEVMAEVYQPLKLSYDKLDTNIEKCFFLLCSLFPEDADIPFEQLIWYSMGLPMFDGISSIEEATNKVHALVGKLKRRFLLIDGRDKLHVKMHDVTRDVAIYIVKSLSSDDVNCNWMSVDISNERMEVPVFPKLRLLLLSSNKSDNDISHISFEGTKDLNVLTFKRISIRSLPPTLGLLKNLRTLCLFDCEVETISVIVELTSLKIFSCCRCRNITELPEDIRRLKDLILLELSGCDKLQRIPFGVISNFRLLEELKMRGSFSRWEAEEKGKERRNASLKELECLRNLSCLEIEIDYCTLSVQEIRLSQNLVKYYIRIGSYYNYRNYFDKRDYEKVMILNLHSGIGAVGKWIQKLARNTELLHLHGDGINKTIWSIKLKDVSLGNLKFISIFKCDKLISLFSVSVAKTSLLQLEHLEILYCDAMEEVFWNDGTNENTNGCIEFPKLKELTLGHLSKLNILFPTKDVSFGNLKSIDIWKCHKLRSLFSVSVAKRSLLQLEDLSVSHCDAMEQVFWNEGTNDNTDGCIEFPKIKELTLTDLPNLTAFCQGLENKSIKFPNLTEMDIGGLPSLNSLFPLNSETVVVDDQNTSLHFFCNSKVEIGCLKYLYLQSFQHNIRNIWCHQIPNNVFNNLEILEIRSINGIRSLMSTSIAKNLTSLKNLRIFDCGELVEVIERDEDDDKQAVDVNCLFPTLIELKMWDLPKLKKFWHWNYAMELPLLKDVHIKDCPIMETFTLGSINTPNIKELRVNNQKVGDKRDMNDVIRYIWTESQDKFKANEDGNENEEEDENKDEYTNKNVN